MRQIQKTTTIHDAGFGLLIVPLLGIPLGIFLDFLWNFAVLSFSLSCLLKKTPRAINSPEVSLHTSVVIVTRTKRLVYSLVITIIGAVVDWAYFELIWEDVWDTLQWDPAMSMSSQFLLLLLPMALLTAANFALAFSLLKMELKQTIALSAIMGFFTAPWLLTSIPHVLGWTT
ncbi:MAG: hypothetical protein R6U37_08735 [Dehalococcoidia bacterium]